MPAKYFAVIDMLFRQQNDWVLKNTTETLTRIGKQAGLSEQQVEDCLKDQALLDKIAADQKYAADVLKVNSTPSFFINGEMVKGEHQVRGIRQAHQGLVEKLILAAPPDECDSIGAVSRSKNLYNTESRKPLHKSFGKSWPAAVALPPRPRHCRGP